MEISNWLGYNFVAYSVKAWKTASKFTTNHISIDIYTHDIRFGLKYEARNVKGNKCIYVTYFKPACLQKVILNRNLELTFKEPFQLHTDIE